jgi:hypothetical protein
MRSLAASGAGGTAVEICQGDAILYNRVNGLRRSEGAT